MQAIAFAEPDRIARDEGCEKSDRSRGLESKRGLLFLSASLDPLETETRGIATMDDSMIYDTSSDTLTDGFLSRPILKTYWRAKGRGMKK